MQQNKIVYYILFVLGFILLYNWITTPVVPTKNLNQVNQVNKKIETPTNVISKSNIQHHKKQNQKIPKIRSSKNMPQKYAHKNYYIKSSDNIISNNDKQLYKYKQEQQKREIIARSKYQAQQKYIARRQQIMKSRKHYYKVQQILNQRNITQTKFTKEMLKDKRIQNYLAKINYIKRQKQIQQQMKIRQKIKSNHNNK
jgi:hypothetical protein